MLAVCMWPQHIFLARHFATAASTVKRPCAAGNYWHGAGHSFHCGLAGSVQTGGKGIVKQLVALVLGSLAARLLGCLVAWGLGLRTFIGAFPPFPMRDAFANTWLKIPGVKEEH